MEEQRAEQFTSKSDQLLYLLLFCSSGWGWPSGRKVAAISPQLRGGRTAGSRAGTGWRAGLAPESARAIWAVLRALVSCV